MKTRTCATVLILAFFGIASPPGQGAGPELSRFSFEEPHMGTRFRVVLYAPDRETAGRAAEAAFARVAELNRIMSDYDPTSELMRLVRKNADKPGEPVPVSEDLFRVLARSQQLSELSGGAFDVTVRPLVQLWRHARRTQKLPDPQELAKAKSVVGYRNVRLDPGKRTVRLLRPGMELDLGGIGKGYAADAALAAMAKLGVNNALVAAGGDVTVRGAPPGRDGWRVEIAPLSKSTPRRVVLLRDAAVSTSGDLEQFVEIDGVRYSHILDPRTGVGLTERKMVTVIAPDGTTADGMTKVLSVLPPEEGLKLLGQVKGAEAMIVRKTDAGEETVKSPGFDRYLIAGEGVDR